MAELTEAEKQAVSAKVKDAFYEARDQGRTMHQAAEDERIAAAVEQILAAREAAAWEAGYVQSSLAYGHIPPEADLSKYGAPNRGPHANPYRAELRRQGGEEE